MKAVGVCGPGTWSDPKMALTFLASGRGAMPHPPPGPRRLALQPFDMEPASPCPKVPTPNQARSPLTSSLSQECGYFRSCPPHMETRALGGSGLRASLFLPGGEGRLGGHLPPPPPRLLKRRCNRGPYVMPHPWAPPAWGEVFMIQAQCPCLHVRLTARAAGLKETDPLRFSAS